MFLSQALFIPRRGVGKISNNIEKRKKRNVISDIRYIRNSLNPVCVKSGLRQKIQRGPFVTLKILQETLYPVCVKSGMGCVIVEGDSSAHFTALKNSPRNVIFGISTAYKAYKICHLHCLKKEKPQL